MPQEATRNDSYCLTCHADSALETRLADGHALSLYVDASALRDSAHGLLGCLTCHPDRESCPAGQMACSGLADHQAQAAETCEGCHLAAAASYADSAHGLPVLSGDGEGATCNDCHSPDGSGHSTSRLIRPRSSLGAESVAESCGGCHENELASYRSTAHSKLLQLGENRPAATCTNCHGDHAVTAVDDPAQPLTPTSLAVACRECHQDADARFAGEWLGHEASASPTGPADYAHRVVVALLVIGVAFRLSHAALDVLRRPGGGRR